MSYLFFRISSGARVSFIAATAQELVSTPSQIFLSRLALGSASSYIFQRTIFYFIGLSPNSPDDGIIYYTKNKKKIDFLKFIYKIFYMNENVNKIQRYLRVLLDSQPVYNILQEKFPDLLDDLISAKTNPTCTCNQRIVEGLTKHYQESDESKRLIDDIFSRPDVVESIKAYEEAIEEWHKKEKEIFGKVHIIGKSSEDWNNFRNFISSQGMHIQGISTIQNGDNLEIRII